MGWGSEQIVCKPPLVLSHFADNVVTYVAFQVPGMYNQAVTRASEDIPMFKTILKCISWWRVANAS